MNDQMVGKKVGRLLVSDYVGTTDNGRIKKYLCLCDCGGKTVVQHTSLYGHTNSCGCLRKEKLREIAKRNALPHGEASFNRFYADYIKNAKKKRIVFDLTKIEFKKITKMPCHYCGEKPKKRTLLCKTYNGEYIGNGVDRLNINLGYVLGNVVPCCSKCNYAKRDMSEAEFINLVTMIYKNMVQK